MMKEGYLFSIYKAIVHMSKQSEVDVVSRVVDYLTLKVSDRITMYKTMMNVMSDKKVDNMKMQSIYSNIELMKQMIEYYRKIDVDVMKLVRDGG